MLALVIRLVVLFAILTVIYVVLTKYFRWNRERELRDRFDSGQVRANDREGYVARGMAKYESSLTKKLLLGVYLLPIGIVVLLIYIADFT
ncbi:hypothetical protein [Denitrobaculum tricleocarpae]|uniref:Cation/multidrug efflux pump n=1 Tax=Denitrobaculum tricleocarpae TaxID=2591009 RepID=A0A545U167_9PROT|nr:hypothetical protein [Denitrobaculum tricleocarpae]TQV83184.1 hypothetical protein FKG95_00865 [Denitrobaculum tricleocarpae]